MERSAASGSAPDEHCAYIDCIDGGWRGYQGACETCGWRGQHHMGSGAKDRARRDKVAHETTTASRGAK